MASIRERPRGDIAEPEMLVFDQFLWECYRGCYPGSRLDLGFHRADDHDGCRGEAEMCYWGSLLWMGDNVWKISSYEQDVDSWWARWPD
jgi:hypothetical protein